MSLYDTSKEDGDPSEILERIVSEDNKALKKAALAFLLKSFNLTDVQAQTLLKSGKSR